MIERSHLRVERWMRLVSPLSFLVSLFLIIVIYQSLVDTRPPPIETGNTTATGKAGNLATLITYTREVKINDDVIAVVSRQLACEGYPVYDFPESTRKYDEGSRTSSRTLVVPFKIKDGTPCQLLSSYSYKPTFSFGWHHVKVPQVPFIVQDIEAQNEQ